MYVNTNVTVNVTMLSMRVNSTKMQMSMDYIILSKIKTFLICHKEKFMPYKFYYILLNKRISVENIFKPPKC